MSRFPLTGMLCALLLAIVGSPPLLGQAVLFEDDFEDGMIDPNKWRIDDSPYETGAGDFSVVEEDGVLTVAGTATMNWWGGLALATIPTFSASEDAPLTFSVDRVSHERVDNVATGAGADSSTRTSIWITDANRENYILFSHNSNEGGWTYNKRVGEPDDNPTAGGANIVEFDALDAGLDEVHTMTVVANGSTAQLILDDIEGPEVSFPVSSGIVFEVGVYARRGEGAEPTDSVSGVFDNVFVSREVGPSVLFEDDFEDAAIDAAKWRTDEAPFENGAGDYEVVEADGTVSLSGTATMNWWGGVALATVPTFSASEEVPLTFTVDRVSHERVDNVATGAGADSSTRSSVWITDANRENYVLFSQNSNEGGWTYNKRVGDPDDNPSNVGISIVEFDALDLDFGAHTMSLVANGSTVQLLLDGMAGPEVSFPFSSGIVFELGIYARRGEGEQPTDSLSAVFDNVVITGIAEDCVSLAPAFSQIQPLEETAPLTLQIPRSAARPATVTITSNAADVAIPEGATDGVLQVVFAEGDEPFRLVPVSFEGVGLAEWTVTTDFDACVTDPVRVFAATTLLEDDFEDESVDEGIWFENVEPYSDGDGSFSLVEEGGLVRIFGQPDDPNWPGVGLQTRQTFRPTRDQPVTFQIDMTLLTVGTELGTIGNARAAVWVSDCDREDFVFLSGQNNTDWYVESTTDDRYPINEFPVAGSGQVPAFECCGFEVLDVTRLMEVIVNGETVSFVVGGIGSGIQVEFDLDEVVFGFGAFAQDTFDTVEATFDNPRILGGPEAFGDNCFGPAAGSFVRGDDDGNGAIEITDPINNLAFQFAGGFQPTCLDALDFDDSGSIDISDPIGNLTAQFLGGPPAPAPSGECGPDPTQDPLTCASFAACQ